MDNDWHLGAVVRRWFSRKTGSPPLVHVIDPDQGGSSSNLQNQPTQCLNPSYANPTSTLSQAFDSTEMSTFNHQNRNSSSQVGVQNTSTAEVPYIQDQKMVYKRKNRERITQEHETVSLIDGWAWKKYGQRVVKGSVYARDYYKCISGNACPAKRHVDTITVNPVKYVVAYYGCHNHPVPGSPNEISSY